MDPAIREVLQAIAEQGLQPTGPLTAFHFRRPTDTFDFEIGFPVAQKIDPKGRVKASVLPAAKVVRTHYHGPYEGLPGAWGEFQNWITGRGLPTKDLFWESYLSDPNTSADPKDWVTQFNRILK